MIYSKLVIFYLYFYIFGWFGISVMFFIPIFAFLYVFWTLSSHFDLELIFSYLILFLWFWKFGNKKIFEFIGVF